MYSTSVEEIVASVPMELLGGTDHAFHGMGREDIDALMLGNGRPFALEIREPKRRRVDPRELQDRINGQAAGKVEVSDLGPGTREEVVRFKDAKCDKSYEVLVNVSKVVTDQKFEELESYFKGKIIKQKTPIRVSHRRADKVREREIQYLKIKDRVQNDVRMKIRSQSGTYIKELITGDEGRTQPSVSGFLEVECKIAALDVVWIHDQEGANDG
jgi:tRNA pseudouridine synthase 10